MLRSAHSRRQGAGENDVIPLLGGDLEIHPVGRRAAMARRKCDAIVDREVDGCRRRHDLDSADLRVRRHPELDGLEVHHQRIGQHVVSAIRPPVERARILRRQGERRIVDHDVAADRFEALGAQHVGEAPPALQGHVGIAAALQNEVAVEHAVAQFAANQRTRVPGKRGPEQVQTGERGEQLDGRCRAARGVAVEARDHPPGIQIDHREADGTQRKALRGGGAHHGRRSAEHGERIGG